MSYYSFIHGFANAPFTSGVSVALNDSSALTQITLDDGTFIDAIYFDKSTFSSNGIISIGWIGNTDGILPASESLSTDDITAGVSCSPSGKSFAINGNTALVLTCDSNITTGQVNVILKCGKYSMFP